MHGLVALDAADRVIRPAILWNDGRTQRQCEAIEETVGLDRLIALTGNRALAGFTAPKLLWLRDEEPDAFAQIRSMLLPKDYVRLRLTGEKATDVSDASGTLLFDVGRARVERAAARRARARPGDPAARARVAGGHGLARGRAGRRRRRRPGGRRGRRRRDRAGRAAVGGAGHERRRLRRAAGVRGRRAGARARVLPRGARACGTRWA